MKEQDRFRSLERQNSINYFTDTLPHRRNNPDVPLIVIMQPLHKEDLGQWIKKNRPDFKVVEFPMLIDGKPLVPELHTLEDIEEIKRTTSNEAWQAKFMLNPITLGGNILKTNLLKYYKETPFLKYRWIEADTAQKTEERHDYTVFQCWGKGYDSGIYLIDQFRKRVEYSDLKQSFKDFWNKHNSIELYDPRKWGHLTSCYVEDKSSGTQIIQEAQREGSIPVIAVPRSRSKYERAVTVAVPKLEAGFIFMPADAPFLLDLKEEMDIFTGEDVTKNEILKTDNKKTFDDQVDCLISACEHGFSEVVGNSQVVNKFMQNRLKRNER